MKRKIGSSFISLVLVLCIFSSLAVSANAAGRDVVVTGSMSDTSMPNSGTVYWSYSYNTSSDMAYLHIWGNGYMPNGTDQDWFQAQQNANRYIYEVKIDEGVKSIMSNAFSGEICLEKINLPDSIERIGENAFAYTAITTLRIPKKVSYLNGAMFAGSSIKSFTVDSANPYYKSYGGDIYSKDLSTLAVVAPGKFLTDNYKYTIQKNVTEIGESAFSNTAITYITIPSNVKSIKKMAFAGCANLSNVVIENGVESLYDNVFLACSSLKELHLPSSVKYIGYCSIGYLYDIAFDALADALDQAGISYGVLSTSNFEYYSIQAGYSSNAFVYCYANKDFKLFAPAGSVGEKYAKNNRLQYIKSSNLISATNGYGGVVLKWNYSDQVFYYNVYRKTATGSWQLLETVDGGKTSYVDTTANNKTDYTYSLKVFYYIGNEYWDTSGISTHYVEAPVLKTVVNNVGGLRITWNPVNNAKYYYVYRKGVGDTAWKYLRCVSGKLTYYVDTTAVGNTKYTYTVRAYDGFGTSGCNQTGVTTTYVQSPSFTVYNTPTDVTIRWTPADKVDAYRIYRRVGNGSWTLLATVNGNIVAYADSTAKRGTTYTYTVRAVYDGVFSCYYPQGKTIKSIAAPMNLKVENRVSGVMINWNKCTGADGYYVYRKVPSGSWVKIATVKGNGTVSYLDTTAKSSQNYVYTVKGYSGSYYGSYDSDGVAIKFLSTPKISSVVSTRNGVSIKYNTVAGSKGYYIYRKTAQGTWSLVGNVKNGTTSTFVDKTAKKGVTYLYTVRAYNGTTRSSFYSYGGNVKVVY